MYKVPIKRGSTLTKTLPPLKAIITNPWSLDTPSLKKLFVIKRVFKGQGLLVVMIKKEKNEVSTSLV